MVCRLISRPRRVLAASPNSNKKATCCPVWRPRLRADCVVRRCQLDSSWITTLLIWHGKTKETQNLNAGKRCRWSGTFASSCSSSSHSSLPSYIPPMLMEVWKALTLLSQRPPCKTSQLNWTKLASTTSCSLMTRPSCTPNSDRTTILSLRKIFAKNSEFLWLKRVRRKATSSYQIACSSSAIQTKSFFTTIWINLRCTS